MANISLVVLLFLLSFVLSFVLTFVFSFVEFCVEFFVATLVVVGNGSFLNKISVDLFIIFSTGTVSGENLLAL